MDIVNLILLILATWRVSHMLVYEGGPFGWFQKMRDRLGVTNYIEVVVKEGYDLHLEKCKSPNILGRLFCCLYCTSVWIAAGWFLLYALVPDAQWLWWIAGISGGASLLHRGTVNE